MTPIIKIIVTLATAAVMCIGPLTFTGSDELPIQEKVIEDQFNPNVETYEKTIAITQSELHLDHEVVQYKILFHDNATIKADARAVYLLRDLNPVAYLFYTSDGEKLIENCSFFCTHEPSGMILDISTKRNHFQIGGRLIYKLLRIGHEKKTSTTFSVSSGDNWYVTIGVYRSIEEEEITLRLKSDKPCMELVPLERHDKIGYFSGWKNEFDSGVYRGFRFLPFLPFGLSFADNFKKTITTTRGGIFSFSSMAHLKALLTVRSPDGKIFTDNRRGIIAFNYAGNLTGNWEFKASGFGFPMKHAVSLFYADVDPHICLGIDGCGTVGELQCFS